MTEVPKLRYKKTVLFQYHCYAFYAIYFEINIPDLCLLKI